MSCPHLWEGVGLPAPLIPLQGGCCYLLLGIDLWWGWGLPILVQPEVQAQGWALSHRHPSLPAADLVHSVLMHALHSGRASYPPWR